MKHFGIDWSEFFAGLEAWEKLSVSARRALIEHGAPRPFLNASDFGGDLFALVTAGFLNTLSNPAKVQLNGPLSPFVRAVRGMSRMPPAKDAHRFWLEAYVREHFDRDEARELLSIGGQPFREADLAAQLGSEEWGRSFLDADAAAWRTLCQRHGVPWLEHQPESAVEAAKQIMTHCAEEQNPIPFQDLSRACPKATPRVLSEAVGLTLRLGLLLATLRRADLEPVIGLWPPARARLQGREPEPPPPVVPEETFSAPFRIADVAELLLQCSREPLPVRRSDGQIYANLRKEMAANLQPLPQWLSAASEADAESRIKAARETARLLGFADTRERRDADRLTIMKAGERWLGLPGKARLQQIIQELARPRIKLLPGEQHLRYEREKLDLPAALGAQLPDEFVPLDPWLQYRRTADNPLVRYAREGGDVHGRWLSRVLTIEELEDVWEGMLRKFLLHMLLPLGGIEAGWTGEAFCFRLNAVGRYVAGLADDFDYSSPDAAPVIVQPNFEVVFLGQSPRLQAEISRFGERTGRSVGAVFRITKASVLRAGTSGLTADEALRTLQNASAKAIPSNVEHEVRAWFAQCRRVSMHRAILIRCPDAETARRVLAAGGKHLNLLNETVVELTRPAERKRLMRKLREQGISVILTDRA